MQVFSVGIIRDPKYPGYVLLTEEDYIKIVVMISRSHNIIINSVAPNNKEAAEQNTQSAKLVR